MMKKWFHEVKISRFKIPGISKNCRTTDYHFQKQMINFSKTLKKPQESISNDMRSANWKLSNSFHYIRKFSSSSGEDEKPITEMLKKVGVTMETSSNKNKKSASKFVKNQRRVFVGKEKNVEDEILMEQARDEVKTVFNILRQDLISCNAYLIEITIPGRDTSAKQEILLEIQELLTYLRKVSRGCAQAAELFPYVKEEISNLKIKISTLSDIIWKKFPHVENLPEKSTPLEICCKNAIENAVEKLTRIETNPSERQDRNRGDAMSRAMDFNSLLEEAQQMLTNVGDVITSTMQQGVEVIKNYEELAANKVSEVMATKKKELADLSVCGDKVKSCMEKNSKIIDQVEDKLRKELTACYKKNYVPLNKVLTEKLNLHEEALSVKNDLQEAMTKCMSADNKTECFLSSLNNLKKKLNALSSRVGDTLKKETEARLKASKAVYECDQKAVDEAYKKIGDIINDAKRCIEQQQQQQK